MRDCGLEGLTRDHRKFFVETNFFSTLAKKLTHVVEKRASIHTVMDSENGVESAHTAKGAHVANAAFEMQAPNGEAEGYDLEKGPSRKLKDASLSLSAQTVRVSLEWRQLNYSIVVKKGKGKAEEGKVTKRILKNLSGTVRAGTFVAIMGPTGRCCNLRTFCVIERIRHVSIVL